MAMRTRRPLLSSARELLNQKLAQSARQECRKPDYYPRCGGRSGRGCDGTSRRRLRWTSRLCGPGKHVKCGTELGDRVAC